MRRVWRLTMWTQPCAVGPQRFARPKRVRFESRKSTAPAGSLQHCSKVAGYSRTAVAACSQRLPSSVRLAKCVTISSQPSLATALPGHPLPLLRQHLFVGDEFLPALLLDLLCWHCAHVDGVASSGVLHGDLAMLGGVVVNIVIGVVLRRVITAIPR